jgi:hypothetical protein
MLIQSRIIKLTQQLYIYVCVCVWNGNIRVLYSLDTFNRRKSSQKKKKKNPDEKYLQNRSINVLNSLREKKTCSKRG